MFAKYWLNQIKNCPETIKFCQSGEISQNLVALGLADNKKIESANVSV